MEDSRIIDLYWARLEQAIQETDTKYGGYCRAIAHNILKSMEDSEECVSDTWLRAWNAMPPERPDYLKLFLAAITRNLSLDRLKERKTAKRGGGAAALALDELSECVSGSPEVEDAVIAKELSESVGRFLDTLPPETRKLFLRRYFFLESAEEIAQMYAMRPGTVTVALHRTRKKLREHLKREGFFDE